MYCEINDNTFSFPNAKEGDSGNHMLKYRIFTFLGQTDKLMFCWTDGLTNRQKLLVGAYDIKAPNLVSYKIHGRNEMKSMK